MAPAGLPKPVLDRLSKAMQKVLAHPGLDAHIRAAGAEPSPSGPGEFQAQLKQESRFWEQTAKAMPFLVHQ
jgi:tripartite-type tricarboxylate transporter receptor subunit TctC